MNDNQKELAKEIVEGVKESALSGEQVEIPLYERYKGKTMHGHGEWPATEKEQRMVKVLGGLFIVLTFAAFFSIPLSRSLESPVVTIVLFVLAFLSAAAMGGYIGFVVYRHHKEQPMEIHYYDVDYKMNRITGKGYDNTREITKEEFYGGKKKEIPDKEEPVS